jgi:predicted ATPase/DNA-binding SARP family transcriptional activator
MDNRLEIFTLGGVRFLRGGEPVKGLSNRKAEALLIYLASTRRPQPREVLADLLWDERSQSQSHANLRVVLSMLRQTVGESLTISRNDVAINPATLVWLDAVQMDDGLQELHQQGRMNASTAGQVLEALALYRGDFLEGFSVFDCRRFEDWQTRERERLHQLVVDGYSELVAYNIEQREYQLGMVHAARLLELDPLMESAHRQMMLLLANCGQRMAALSQYVTCQKLLQEELGVDPAAETVDLYQQIHTGKLKGDEQHVQISLQSILDTRLHNLPMQLTSFVGREKESAEIVRLLSKSRLVTLTGSGGVGKTRLALEVCNSLHPDYLHGIWLVELAPVSDSEYVIPTIASVFNLTATSRKPLLEVLLDYLKQKELMLLLDNCEHLVETCASVLEAILKNAPQLRILVTSREAMGVPGETTFYVPSLSLPDTNNDTNLETLEHSEAVRLFVDRAALVMPGFQLSAENASAAAQICLRLDGIPLAIELAAARVKHLRVTQIANYLEDSFRLLTGGSRTALPRQQTLRATIDWSYNLLSEPERIVFRRLAIFAGGWELEAAESVCSDRENCQPSALSIQPGDILDLLSGLVSKSMVIVERELGMEARYRLLETNRQYAQEKLLDSGEIAELRKRHLDYFLKWTETAEPKLQGAERAGWYERLEMNLENLRLALKNGLESDPLAALRLASALRPFWAGTNHRLEGIHWLEKCLQKPENSVRTMHRGRALCTLTDICQVSLNYQDLWRKAQEALEICLEQGDLFGQAYAHFLLGYLASENLQDFPAAKVHIDASLEQFRAIGNRWWEARALRNFAELFENSGDISVAKVYEEQSLKMYRELQDDSQIAVCLFRQAYILGEHEGNFRSGRELYEQSLVILERLKLDYTLAYVRGMLACLAIWQGDFIYATQLSGKVALYYNHIGDTQQALLQNEFVARLMAFQGLYTQAVDILEQTIDQFNVMFPQDLGSLTNHVSPTLAYALANLNQIERAKETLNKVNRSQVTWFFDLLMLLRVRGLLAFLEGDAQESIQLYQECLEYTLKVKYKVGEILALEGCGGALYLLGHHPEAVQCLAAAGAFRNEIGAPIWPGDLPFHERVRSGLSEKLGEDAYQEQWKTGESMSLDQAAKQVLSILK